MEPYKVPHSLFFMVPRPRSACWIALSHFPVPLMTTAAWSPVPQTPLEAPLAKGPGAAPMQRQLHHRFKEAILGGHLAPGSRLPGSRALAEALAISRNTVTAAYDLLAAEGDVQPDRQGTRVAALSRPAPLQGKRKGP